MAGGSAPAGPLAGTGFDSNPTNRRFPLEEAPVLPLALVGEFRRTRDSSVATGANDDPCCGSNSVTCSWLPAVSVSSPAANFVTAIESISRLSGSAAEDNGFPAVRSSAPNTWRCWAILFTETGNAFPRSSGSITAVPLEPDPCELGADGVVTVLGEMMT